MVMMKMISLGLLSSSLTLVQSQLSQSHLLAKRDAEPLLNNFVGDLAEPFLNLFGVGQSQADPQPLESYQKPTYYHKPTYHKPSYTQKPVYHKPSYTQKPTYHKPTYATVPTYYKPTYETYHYTPEYHSYSTGYTTPTPVYHSTTTYHSIYANLVEEPETEKPSAVVIVKSAPLDEPAIPPPFEPGNWLKLQLHLS